MESRLSALTLVSMLATAVACSSGDDSNSTDPAGGGGPADSEAEASWSGEYVVLVQDDATDDAEASLLSLSIDSTHHVIVRWASTVVAETDIEDDRVVSFTGVVTESGSPIAFEGALRRDGSNRTLWGTWSSRSGHTGLFGGYGKDNQYAYLSELDPMCETAVACGLMSSITACISLVNCGAGFYGAESTDCADAIAQSLTASMRQIGSLSAPSNCVLQGTDPADSMPATCHANADLCSQYFGS